jgi:choline dehydrogenase-like flavoprotein
VLVIERGDFDNKPEAIIPYYANALDTSVLMRVPSAPDEKLNNLTYSVAAAAVVGGGSIVNGMGYNRGSKADYDGWEALGNPGWGWAGLFPYFVKSTTFIPPSPHATAQWNITWDASAYGNGPLHLHIPNFQYPDVATFWDAFRNEPGIEVTGGGSNLGATTGAYWNPSNIDARDMTRSTARKAYYDTVNATRTNLHLLRGHTATEILFAPGKQLRANGVRIVSRLDNTTHDIYAKKEVILAAGALMTPQLLQASGIGPAAVLKASGVQVRKDMPAVGANFQDHPTIFITYALANQSFPNPGTITKNATYNATVWDEYFTNKTGPIAASTATTILYFTRPQLQSQAAAAELVARLLAQEPAQYLPSSYGASGALIRGFEAQRAVLAGQFNSSSSAITMWSVGVSGGSAASLYKPLSRGTVTLNPSDPDGLPIVTYHTFMNPVDSENVIAIFRRLRAFWQNPALARLGPSEVAPGPQFQTDNEILTELTTNHALLRPTLAHPSCTCAMMPERLGGCVSPDLEVYGVRDLRIVDASIMPIIPAGGLQGTVYAVAEKAADLIKKRWA